MSKTKRITALIGAMLVAPVWAQSSSPLTIQEWTIMQGNLKRAEYANKLREEQKKGADGPVAVVLDRTCDDDLRMSAVYGVGHNLRADFVYRGATVTLSPGGDADMGGWSVKELTPTRALMVKKNKSSKALKTCPLYLSAAARDFSAPIAPLTGAGDSHVRVPPISPVSTLDAASEAGVATSSQKPGLIGGSK